MVKIIRQLTEEELRNLIKVATSRISDEMNSNRSLQMNCEEYPADNPNGFLTIITERLSSFLDGDLWDYLHMCFLH